MRECVFLNRLAEKVVTEHESRSVLCEIGSFCGKSTVSIAKALVKNNAGILYAIDWHEGSPTLPGFGTKEYKVTYNEYLNNLEKFGVKERIKTIKKRSEESVHDIPDEVHFLWIDGLHEYEGVKSDYKNYAGKLVSGGFLLFHDVCWTTWKDPFRLVKGEVLSNNEYNLYAMIGNTMIFRKEMNRMNKMMRNILCVLCECVSGRNRPWYKKIASAVFFRLTTYYTILFHNWSK